MVYTSLSLSLALVEVFVHLNADEEPEDFVSIAAELPVDWPQFDRQKSRTLRDLPTDWHDLDNSALQHLGAAWCRGGKSLTMPVPSAVVDGEWNVLINPRHPDSATIKMHEPKPFRFDSRMFKRAR